MGVGYWSERRRKEWESGSLLIPPTLFVLGCLSLLLLRRLNMIPKAHLTWRFTKEVAFNIWTGIKIKVLHLARLVEKGSPHPNELGTIHAHKS